MKLNWVNLMRVGQIGCLVSLLGACTSIAPHIAPPHVATAGDTPDSPPPLETRTREAQLPPPNPVPIVHAELPTKISVGDAPPTKREFNPTLSSSTVEYHVWQPLTQIPAAAWTTPRYKMYTYVLFNGAAYHAKLNYDEKQALQRLSRLLDTIGHTEDFAGTPENQVRNRQATNVFLIPTNTPHVTSAQLENYSIGVSRQYLEYFNSALSNNRTLHKQLRKNGPFLLATLKPIGEMVKLSADAASYQIDRSQPILLVNLTGAHEKSVGEIVRAFKNHLADVPLTGVSALEPLRLKLVSLLLKLNDAIPIVNNAVAGSCGMVGMEAACK